VSEVLPDIAASYIPSSDLEAKCGMRRAVTIQVDRELRNARSAIPPSIGKAMNAGNRNTNSRNDIPSKFAIGRLLY
jgi:hypothetical protein